MNDTLSTLVISGLNGQADEALALFEKYPPGGVILFDADVTGVDDLRALNRAIRALPTSPLVMIDHEGGRVNRLRSILGDLPGAETLSSLSTDAIATTAAGWGRALHDLGIEVDFAPVVDLGPAIPGSGLEGRVWGDTPQIVAERAGAFLQGLQASGIAGCIKHFPGLGEAPGDTHATLPVVRPVGGMERHIEPFKRLHSHTPLLMVSHALYPDLDLDLPASLSPTINALPCTWSYDGLIVSDDLEMGALSTYGDLPDLAFQALSTECSGVIISHRWERLPDVVEALAALPPVLLEEKHAAWAKLKAFVRKAIA